MPRPPRAAATTIALPSAWKRHMPIVNASNAQVESVYTIGGQRINKAQRGLNIIHTKDGMTKKVVVK